MRETTGALYFQAPSLAKSETYGRVQVATLLGAGSVAPPDDPRVLAGSPCNSGSNVRF
ncbi:hypothetical protein [Roseobacter fucihabitans]|uniref:hypothetical protein n=1 Tax=Roseobacter fucihabitans TaxID=1537242 RepID=UPI0016530AF5